MGFGMDVHGNTHYVEQSVVPNLFCVAPPFCDRSTEIPPPPNKLPIQLNIPYNLNNIYVVIRNNNSVKLYDDFKEQRKIMGFSEMVVPASYAPIFLIVFESCPLPPPPPEMAKVICVNQMCPL